MTVGGSFNSNSLLNWSRAPPEFKSGVSGSLCLAVPDPDPDPAFSRFGYVSQSYAPYEASLGVTNSVLIIGILQVSSRELGGA